MVGRTRCELHGGKTPVGIASPHFKTGRHSKYLPANLRGSYEAALSDPELLSLREEVALVDARLADLLQKVDTGESRDAWKQAKKLLTKYTKALTSGYVDEDELTDYLRALHDTITNAVETHQSWNQIYSVLEQRRKLVESENKRLAEMQQFITAEKAMVLIANLTDIIKRHVTDRATLSAISNDLVRLTSFDAGRVVDG